MVGPDLLPLISEGIASDYLQSIVISVKEYEKFTKNMES
jgi:hypothetical protein